MRTLLLASLALCAACGQKGPLVLPQRSVATPVLIRAPAAEAAPQPGPPAAQPATESTPAAKRPDDEPPPPQR